MTTEIRFFALKSKTEKVLDRGQNGFNVKTTTSKPSEHPIKAFLKWEHRLRRRDRSIGSTIFVLLMLLLFC